jgi:hypothetical protein
MRKKVVLTQIDEELKCKLEAEAKRQDRSLSNVVRRILQAAIEVQDNNAMRAQKS